MVFQKLALITLAAAGFAAAAPLSDTPGWNGAICIFVLEPSVTPVVPIPGESIKSELVNRMYSSSVIYCPSS
jgi:hypothetical protein